MLEKPITKQDLEEGLIYLAWLGIRAENVLLEIDRSCVRLTVARETFTIKTLVPVYPLLED